MDGPRLPKRSCLEKECEPKTARSKRRIVWVGEECELFIRIREPVHQERAYERKGEPKVLFHLSSVI